MSDQVERIARIAFAVLTTFAVGCAEEDRDPTFCCALQSLCASCSCTNNPEYDSLGASADGDACRFVLEDNELGCTTLSEEEAIAGCAREPEP
jgi:hypothetical protein